MVTPELALSGYPPEDLLFHRGFRRRIDEGACAPCGRGTRHRPARRLSGVLRRRAVQRRGLAARRASRSRITASSACRTTRSSTRSATSRRETSAVAVEFGGIRIAPLICEDVWHVEPAAAARDRGRRFCHRAECLAVPAGQAGGARREHGPCARARPGMPFMYLNLVGGQDELVFDGSSFVTRRGRAARASRCRHSRNPCPAFDVTLGDGSGEYRAGKPLRRCRSGRRASGAPSCTASATTWASTAFQGVVLGLSGGVDSALVLALACDALGARASTP